MRINSSTSLDYRIVAAIVYLAPVVGSVIFLALDGKDVGTRAHCVQMLALTIVMAIIHVAMCMIMWIPLVGVVFRAVDWLCFLCYAGLCIAGLAAAIRGGILRIPALYNIIDKFIY